MIHLLISSALAGTYYSELPIPASAPTSDEETAISVVQVADVGTGHPNQEQDSDWPWVRCGVADGDVYAAFTGTKDNWPASIPATATCSQNGETWVLDLIPTTTTKTITVAGKLVTFDLGPDTLGQIGIELRAAPWTSVPMPPFVATKNGSPWVGVKCSVGGGVLRIRVQSDADGGSGTCTLDTSGGSFPVDVTVIR